MRREARVPSLTGVTSVELVRAKALKLRLSNHSPSVLNNAASEIKVAFGESPLPDFA
jgi:hypothetical protein